MSTADGAAIRVGGEGGDDVAFPAEPLGLEADQVGAEDRGHRLVVDRAARVVVAVLLGELEGVEAAGPVLLLRLDDVEVGEEQEGLELARAAQPCDQVPLERSGHPYLDVLRVEARVEEALRHRLRGGRDVAVGIDGADLDQLAIDVVEALLARGERLRKCGSGNEGKAAGEKRDSIHRIPGIMPFMLRSILPSAPVRIIFIIFCIRSNWVSRRFTSCTCTPAPAAIRRLREALRSSGLRRSSGVIELMIASVRRSAFSCRSGDFSAICVICRGSLSGNPASPPISFIYCTCARHPS